MELFKKLRSTTLWLLVLSFSCINHSAFAKINIPDFPIINPSPNTYGANSYLQLTVAPEDSNSIQVSLTLGDQKLDKLIGSNSIITIGHSVNDAEVSPKFKASATETDFSIEVTTGLIQGTTTLAVVTGETEESITANNTQGLIPKIQIKTIAKGQLDLIKDGNPVNTFTAQSKTYSPADEAMALELRFFSLGGESAGDGGGSLGTTTGGEGGSGGAPDTGTPGGEPFPLTDNGGGCSLQASTQAVSGLALFLFLNALVGALVLRQQAVLKSN